MTETEETQLEIPSGADTQELEEKLNEMQQDNTGRVQKLAALGFRVDQAEFLAIKLNCLLSVILDNDSRLKLELMAQSMIATSLDTTLAEAARRVAEAELVKGVPGVDPNAPKPGPSGLIL